MYMLFLILITMENNLHVPLCYLITIIDTYTFLLNEHFRLLVLVTEKYSILIEFDK